MPKPSAAKVPESSLAKALVWHGIAIEEPDFTIRGASPILADGQAHLFAARWPPPKLRSQAAISGKGSS